MAPSCGLVPALPRRRYGIGCNSIDARQFGASGVAGSSDCAFAPGFQGAKSYHWVHDRRVDLTRTKPCFRTMPRFASAEPELGPIIERPVLALAAAAVTH